MQYIEVDITLEKTVPFSEIIIAKLDVLKFDTFQENDNGLKCYIQTNLLDKNKLSKILNDVSSQTKLEYSLRKMPEKNWNLEWEKNSNQSKLIQNALFAQIFMIIMANMIMKL